MELFLDTANLEDIKQWAYLLDGITTNPSHLAKKVKTQQNKCWKFVLS